MRGYIFRGKSYEIIEPRKLNCLFGQPKYFEYAVACFYFLIHYLRSELKKELVNLDLEVIRVTYMGSYPAIGIYYPEDFTGEDIGPIVEAAIDRLLETKSLLEFVAFAGEGTTDWKAITKQIMES